MRKYYIFIGLLCLFCLGLIVAVMMQTNSPARQKTFPMDQSRMNDFGVIASAIDSYYMIHHKLPGSLQELKSFENYIVTTDPETNTTFPYKVTGTDTYQLCATFSADSKDDAMNAQPGYTSTFNADADRQHKKGYDCISYTVPSMYRSAATPAPTTARPATPAAITN